MKKMLQTMQRFYCKKQFHLSLYLLISLFHFSLSFAFCSDLLERNEADSGALLGHLQALRNIAESFKSVVHDAADSAKILGQLQEKYSDTNVRQHARNLLEFLEGRDASGVTERVQSLEGKLGEMKKQMDTMAFIIDRMHPEQ
jgi:hypothetical protein